MVIITVIRAKEEVEYPPAHEGRRLRQRPQRSETQSESCAVALSAQNSQLQPETQQPVSGDFNAPIPNMNGVTSPISICGKLTSA